MDPDELYGLPLDRFVDERAACAKALRADKRRDEAAAVAGLRKPSIAAWAVNQLLRSHEDDAQALFDAGDALRAAQANLLAGTGDARTLRAAAEDERAAVDRLAGHARGLASAQALSPAVVERVADTLHAAALDEDAREQVRGGRLVRELRHAGLGLGFGFGEVAAPAPKRADGKEGLAGEAAAAGAKARGMAPAPQPDAEQRADAARAAKQRADAARAEADRLKRERAAARTAEAQARRAVERADRALHTAQERRERAAQALAEADEALASARKQVDEAAAAHERARSELG